MSTPSLRPVLFRPRHPALALTLGLALAGVAPIHAQQPGEKSMTAAQTVALKINGVVSYSDFGAKGDGKSDDGDAIAAAHQYANKHGLPVKADDGMTFYFGEARKTIGIETDTDFGTAKFIIDDSKVEVKARGANIFQINSQLKSFTPEGISSLKRKQANIGITLPGDCLIVANNAKVKRYIRYGLNQNNGSAQTDVFLVDKDGNVDPNTPIIWDFDEITSISAQPLDKELLTVRGGHFTTIANQAESKYTYYGRGIAIRRSNVLVTNLRHEVIGEGDHGAPYSGFLNIGNCANVTVRDTVLTGRMTYRTIGSAGKPVSMGSYDISIGRALNVSFINCSQTNDINDRRYWGIFGSNYCKNLSYDGCSFSRFDAHMGVANASIRNSTMGHAGVNAIGCGTFTIENSTINGWNFISLRGDYGSTWEGEFIIRNCVFIPGAGAKTNATLIGGSYSGMHDFGYTCYMPERIVIDGLHIKDGNANENYAGPAVFGNFNPKNTSSDYVEKFPYVITKEVIAKGVRSDSGKPLRISDNTYMFRNVKLTIFD
ncbi:MAG: hypothetical protein ACOX9E_07330 [Lentisphaeria bacterium]|jgi:hypothetical protein